MCFNIFQKSKEVVYFLFFFKQGTQVRRLRNRAAATAPKTYKKRLTHQQQHFAKSLALHLRHKQGEFPNVSEIKRDINVFLDTIFSTEWSIQC